MPDEINLHELETLLLAAARSAFTEVQQQHADEHFYAFSLFHEPFWIGNMPGIMLASNTEEGLDRRVEIYQNFQSNVQANRDDLRKKLRWLREIHDARFY